MAKNKPGPKKPAAKRRTKKPVKTPAKAKSLRDTDGEPSYDWVKVMPTPDGLEMSYHVTGGRADVNGSDLLEDEGVLPDPDEGHDGWSEDDMRTSAATFLGIHPEDAGRIEVVYM